MSFLPFSLLSFHFYSQFEWITFLTLRPQNCLFPLLFLCQPNKRNSLLRLVFFPYLLPQIKHRVCVVYTMHILELWFDPCKFICIDLKITIWEEAIYFIVFPFIQTQLCYLTTCVPKIRNLVPTKYQYFKNWIGTADSTPNWLCLQFGLVIKIGGLQKLG